MAVLVNFKSSKQPNIMWISFINFLYLQTLIHHNYNYLKIKWKILCSSKPWFNNRLHYIVFDQTYVTGVAHYLSAIKNYRQKCEYFDQTKRTKFDFRQAKAYLQNPSKCYVWLMNLLELGRLPLSGKCQRPPGKSSKIPRTLGKLCPGCICIPCT